MTDTFDAVLAEMRAESRFDDGRLVHDAATGGQLEAWADRLAAAHAAEVAVKKSLAKEVWAAIARAEAAASGQGVEGWTIQVKRGGPDDELGIWAVDPDGSSIWLAPAQEGK